MPARYLADRGHSYRMLIQALRWVSRHNSASAYEHHLEVYSKSGFVVLVHKTTDTTFPIRSITRVPQMRESSHVSKREMKNILEEVALEESSTWLMRIFSVSEYLECETLNKSSHMTDGSLETVYQMI